MYTPNVQLTGLINGTQEEGAQQSNVGYIINQMLFLHPSLNINTVLYWYTDMVLVQTILDPYYIKKSLYNVGSLYCGMLDAFQKTSSEAS